MSETAGLDGSIRELLSRDHDRLDELLARSVAPDQSVNRAVFDAFRAGLARHIGMEEKIFFRAGRAAGCGLEATLERLRRDHGRLIALIVPTPTVEIIAEIRALLGPHNEVEEGPSGVYARCEAALGEGAAAVRRALESAPDVPMRPAYDGPIGALRR